MATAISIWPTGLRVTNPNGQAISGAKIKFFQAGTTTPMTVFSDLAMTIPLGPIVYTDAGGYPIVTAAGTQQTQIYVSNATPFKMQITDSNDVDVIPAKDYIQSTVAGAAGPAGANGGKFEVVDSIAGLFNGSTTTLFLEK